MQKLHLAFQFFEKILKHKSARTGLIIIMFLLIIAIIGPHIAPYDYRQQFMEYRLRAPSVGFWLGTDLMGRDIFSRIILGTAITIKIGFFSVMIGLIMGMLLGLLAGYLGGTVDRVISGIIEVMLAFPSLLLALVIIAILGPGLVKVMIAVGIRSMPIFARLVRGEVLKVKNEEYVIAGQALGAKQIRILLKHIVPNIFAPVFVMATLQISIAILSAAELSFLGLGAQPPTPDWGSMVSDGREVLRFAWWISTFPGLAIMVAVMGFNLLGDGLRDILDPRL